MGGGGSSIAQVPSWHKLLLTTTITTTQPDFKESGSTLILRLVCSKEIKIKNKIFSCHESQNVNISNVLVFNKIQILEFLLKRWVPCKLCLLYGSSGQYANDIVPFSRFDNGKATKYLPVNVSSNPLNFTN